LEPNGILEIILLGQWWKVIHGHQAPVKPSVFEICCHFFCPRSPFGCFFVSFLLFPALAASVDPLFFQLYFRPGLTIDQSGTKIKLKNKGSTEAARARNNKKETKKQPKGE